jgi:uncharacterized integral membrane protein
MIRLIFMILVIFALFGFAYTNQNQTASLYLFWGVHSEPIPIYLIVIASFLLGTTFAALMVFPGWIKLKLERRRLAKRIEQLEVDLDHLRSEALKLSTPAPYSSETDEMQDDFPG